MRTLLLLSFVFLTLPSINALLSWLGNPTRTPSGDSFPYPQNVSLTIEVYVETITPGAGAGVGLNCFLVYTTDNWASYGDAPLTYLGDAGNNDIYSIDIINSAPLTYIYTFSCRDSANNPYWIGSNFQFTITDAPWNIVIKTSNRASAESNGQMRLRLIGSLGTLGPFVVANKPTLGSTAAFSTLVDTATFGDLWAVELLNSKPSNGWIVETISVQTASKTIPLGNPAGQMIREKFIFEAPITVIAKTRTLSTAGTPAAVYIGFRDAVGSSRPVPLGRSFAAGSIFTKEIPYINLGAITSISLGTPSDDWAFDSIVVVKRGVETTFHSAVAVTPKNSPLVVSA